MKNKLLLLVFGLIFSSQLIYSQIPSYVPTNGLKAWYPFSNNANDISGSNLNGSVVGAMPTTDRYGNVNSAYSFTNNQQINIPSTATLNYYPITISLWYNASVFPTGAQTNVFSKYVSASWDGYQILYGDNTNVSNNGGIVNNGFGTQSWYLRGLSDKVIGYYGEPSFLQSNINLNTWYHYVFVLDSSGGKIYVNGQLISTHSWTGTPAACSNNFLWKIGGQYDSSVWFNGKIDDIGIWNRALTSSEIQQLYTPCTAPVPTGIAAQTLCSGATIADLSATGSNIQWYSDATGGTAIPLTTALINGTTYYASQTVSGCESSARLAVAVSLNNPTVSASATSLCAGQSTTLTATSGAAAITNFSVGSIGPSGGYVFYDQGSVIDGWRYLEAAPTDNGSDSGTGCYCTTILNTSNLVGTGKTNTTNWINAGCTGGWFSLGQSIDINGLTNWFVPSKDELNLMYTKLKLNNLGNFSNIQYWTSSPEGYGSCGINGGAWVQNFTNGAQLGEYRSGYQGAGNLRLVRQFATGTPFSSYLWSTGETTATINVTPTTTTQYWVDVTTNGVTCRKNITITVSPNSVPTFTSVPPICSGNVLASLPSISTDGVTGTWSPAIDNTATTTYSFTPDPGQCATSATMTITVIPCATNPICGENFFDNGGANANYSNNITAATGTTTICPTSGSGDVVTVTFTSFWTESTYDVLKVYNGAVSSANLVGTYSGQLTGAALPGPFTSSDPSGCLTFVFTSDSSFNNPGWSANITCAPLPTCTKPITLTSSNVTENSATVGWIQPQNPDGSVATDWQYIALPCGTPAPTASSTGWLAAPTNPYVVTNLTSGTCYNIYVRANCSSETSAWSFLPVSISTLPGCGATFFDNGGPNANYANNTNGTTTICPNSPGDVVTVTFNSFATESGWDFLKVYDGNSATGSLLGNYSGILTGANIPGPFTSSDPSGCLTFVFTSDLSFNSSGWNANVTCAPAPICAKPTNLTATSITQSSALLGWAQPANPDGSIATSWQVMGVPCGTAAPTILSTGWVNTTTNSYNFNGLNSISCYDFYVRANCSLSDSSSISGPFRFQTLISNDECTNAITVPVNQNTNCLQTVVGSLATASASPEANSCGAGIDDDDVWFKFTATATSHYITILGVNYTAAPTNINYVLYTGTCGSLTQFGTCITANNNTANGLTIGQTYYIRAYSTGVTAVTTSFELCVGTKVESCSNALSLCATQPQILPNNVGVPALPNPISPYSTTSAVVGCLATAPSPTFFNLHIPSDGNYNFLIEQNTNNTFTGTGIDVDFVAWGPYNSNAEACAGISTTNAPATGIACSYSAAFTENFSVNNALAGKIYVLMISNFNGRKGFIRITQTAGATPTTCCPSGNFSYSNASYCVNETDPSPIFTTNATAGVFSAVPSTGLSINPTTGLINLATSSPGTYVIHNSIASSGTCPADDKTCTITINAIPTATISGDATICYNASSLINFTGTPNATVTYTVNGGPNQTTTLDNFGIASVSTGNLTATTTYQLVNVSLAGIPSCNQTQLGTVVVAVIPVPLVISVVSSPSVCSGQPSGIVLTTSNVTSATFNWTITQSGVSGASAGSGNTISQNLTATGIVPGFVTYNITANEGNCIGPVTPITITVNPFPIIVASATAITICSNDNYPIMLASSAVGTTFSWNSVSTDVVGAMSGSGSVISDFLTAIGSNPGTVVYTITPSANGCTGIPITATVTVNPMPTVFVPADANYSNNDTVPDAVFTSNLPGVTYTWTNSDSSIGLAANGIGSIPSFVAHNSSSVPITAYITVIPSLNGCLGMPITYSITVAPIPTIGNISISSTRSNIDLFDTITVDVQITNTTDLYSLYMKLKGNLAVSQYLDYSGYTAGTLLGSPADIIATDPIVTNGEYDFGITKIGAVPGYSGSGLFYTFRFVTKNIPIPVGTNFCFYLDEINAYNPAGAPCNLTNQGQYCYTFSNQTNVWPGDLNNSHTVTTADILPIGYFYNSTGPTRPNATILWNAQPAVLWGYNHNSINGTAYKVFADSNGDGVINNADQAAIGRNMNQLHSKLASPSSLQHNRQSSLTLSNGDLIITPNTTIVNALTSQTITFSVSLNNTGGLNGLYGISVNLLFDNTVFDLSTATIDYTGSIFGTAGSDCLVINHTSTSMESVGLTRFANAAINGHGLLFKVTMRTRFPFISPLTQTLVNSNVEAANNQYGDPLVIQDATSTNITIINNLGVNTIESTDFILYPNPADELVNIVLGTNALLLGDLNLKVINILGQTVEKMNIQGPTTEISTRNWGASGVYFVEVTNSDNTVLMTKKVIVVRK